MDDKLSKQIYEVITIYEMKTPGFIPKIKLALILEDFGIMMTQAEFIKFESQFQADPKGLLRTAEIVDKIDPMLRRLTLDKLKKSFSTFDRDKDGKIPKDDLEFAMLNYGKALKEADFKNLHSLVGNKDPIETNELSKILMS